MPKVTLLCHIGNFKLMYDCDLNLKKISNAVVNNCDTNLKKNKKINVVVIAYVWTPYFDNDAFPTQNVRLVLYFRKNHFESGFWSRNLFYFIFLRENKIRKKP